MKGLEFNVTAAYGVLIGILGECYESILECSSCILTAITVKWTKDVWWCYAVPRKARIYSTG